MVDRRGAAKLGCLFYLLVMSALLYFGVNAGEIYFRYFEFKDAMKQEVRFRSHLSDQQIKAHFRALADSLDLPEEAGRLTVSRRNGVITLESEYVEVIDLPFTKREVTFNPRVSGNY